VEIPAMKKKKACYTPAAVKNGRVSKAHKTYSNPGPAKAGAVRLAKAAGGKPVVLRNNGKGSGSFTLYRGSMNQAKSVGTYPTLKAAKDAASAYRGHPHSWLKHSFSRDEVNWIDEWNGGPGNDFRIESAPYRSNGKARANPKNPLRQVVLGHTVTWSPKKGGYVIDAYQMVFPKVKELRAYLKEHVAKELRHR
jgi:hypothetical protein